MLTSYRTWAATILCPSASKTCHLACCFCTDPGAPWSRHTESTSDPESLARWIETQRDRPPPKVTLELEALSKHEAVAGTLLRQMSIGVLRSWLCKVYQLLRAVSQPGFSSNWRGIERPELKREFQRKRKWKSWATHWLSPNKPAVRQEPSERKKKALAFNHQAQRGHLPVELQCRVHHCCCVLILSFSFSGF